MYRAIAEKLRADSSLLAIAHDNLDRWSQEVLALMVEDGEKMTAMRQANPFPGILTPRGDLRSIRAPEDMTRAGRYLVLI